VGFAGTGLCVRCQDKEDATAKSKTPRALGEGAALARQPPAPQVEKVYELGDFGGLGIGT
jgi:hypothetical protein